MKRWQLAAVVSMAGMAAVAAYASYEFGRGDIVELQVCAEINPAPIAWVCKQSLLAFHPTAEEIAFLNRTAGAHIPASTSDVELANQLLRRYIEAGMNINAVDERTQTKLTALHVMVMEPNPRAVALLLEFGADPAVRDLKGRSAMDLARELHAKEPTLARSEVLKAVEGARP